MTLRCMRGAVSRSLTLVVALSGTCIAGPLRPPDTPVVSVTEERFGTALVDPYRWMERDDRPFADWLKAQADYARSSLDAIAGRDALLHEISSLDAVGQPAVNVRAVGNALVYRRGVSLYARTLPSGPERALVDGAARGFVADHVRITTVLPSSDGRLVAYATIRAGSEAGTIRFLDLRSGRELPETIERADTLFAQSWWLDSTRFAYFREKAPNAITDSTPAVHRMGTDARLDVPVFSGAEPFEATGETSLIIAPRYTVAIASKGYYLADTAALGTPRVAWRKLAVRAEQRGFVNADDGHVYLLTTQPHFIVEALDPRAPGSAAKVVFEAAEPARFTAFAADALYVVFAHGAGSRLGRLTYDGRISYLELPYEANVLTMQADRKTPGITLALSAWTSPTSWFRFTPGEGRFRDLGLAERAAPAYRDIVADEVLATSQDGTAVPLSIVHARDIRYDGSHPTILRVYGAFGLAQGPQYDPKIIPWLARGGVIAVAHARGGGELGDAWATAGKMTQKHHTVEDFLACARYLIEHRLASPAHLVGQGGSAGGVPVGVATVTHPELFAAMLDDVPVSDLLRSSLMKSNVSEFGTPDVPAQFAEMYAMSSYYHVQPGTRYPAVLLTTGINDPRVRAWEVAKMAARLQAATASGKPVLLRVDYDAGHGAASQAASDALLADQYAFALSQAG